MSPTADIYSIGKLAIALLGGDIASNRLPVGLDARVCDFIHRMTESDVRRRPYDAWKLGGELVAIRRAVFRDRRFIPLYS